MDFVGGLKRSGSLCCGHGRLKGKSEVGFWIFQRWMYEEMQDSVGAAIVLGDLQGVLIIGFGVFMVVVVLWICDGLWDFVMRCGCGVSA